MWEGWVKSRLRVLVQNLEGSVNVRPLAQALRPPEAAAGGTAARPRQCYFLAIWQRERRVRLGLAGAMATRA